MRWATCQSATESTSTAASENGKMHDTDPYPHPLGNAPQRLFQGQPPQQIAQHHQPSQLAQHFDGSFALVLDASP